MRKLALAFAIGTSSIVVFGCSTAPEPRKNEGARDPVAVAKVSSTKSTLKLTSATTWRIYGGQTQVVIMGFGKDKKPIDGMRVRINPMAKEPTDTWLSLESLKKSGGVMELGLNNKVLTDTTSPADKKIFHGALRAAAAYAKKKGTLASSSSTTSAKSRLVAFATNTCSLAEVMSTVASCSGQRPACKKDPKGTLMCGITSVQCAADANKAMVECSKKANAAGGAAETKKNPPPKAASLPLPKLPGSLGGSAGTKKSSGATSTKKSGTGSNPSSGGKGGSCEEDGTCDDTDPQDEEDFEDPEEVGDEDEGDFEDEDVEDEDFGDGEFDDDGDFDDDVDADPFGDEDFADEDFGDFGGDDFGGDDFGDFGGDFESFTPTLQPKTVTGASNTPSVMSSASCGARRVLQCGSRSSMTFCRCVVK